MGFTLNQLEQERQIKKLQKKEDKDTSDYEQLSHLPKINSVELKGNKTSSALGLANAADIATVFSEATNYTAGCYVYYEGILYRFNADHAAGAWDLTDVVEANVTDQIVSNKAAIDEVEENVLTLSNRVAAHTFGTAVNVATYTPTNKYTCPSDGYIRYETSGQGPTAVIYVNGILFGYVNSTTANSIFVKKGAKIHCTNVNNTVVEFIPIS